MKMRRARLTADPVGGRSPGVMSSSAGRAASKHRVGGMQTLQLRSGHGAHPYAACFRLLSPFLCVAGTLAALFVILAVDVKARLSPSCQLASLRLRIHGASTRVAEVRSDRAGAPAGVGVRDSATHVHARAGDEASTNARVPCC